jgi:hypothetical protein
MVNRASRIRLAMKDAPHPLDCFIFEQLVRMSITNTIAKAKGNADLIRVRCSRRVHLVRLLFEGSPRFEKASEYRGWFWSSGILEEDGVYHTGRLVKVVPVNSSDDRPESQMRGVEKRT